MNSELLAHGDVEPTLGVARHSGSTTFRVFSQHATALWLCLFDGPDGRESDRVPMARKASGVWETTLGGVAPGQLYGFRAEGPYALETGHRFNPAKLLFDPYARSYRGSVTYHRSLEDHPPWSPHGSEDSAPFVPKAEVLDLIFDWEGDRAPAVPWQETVVYEAHVKGLTALHPRVPARLRGSFSGLAHPAVIEHLLDLGVTSVELLPIFFAVTEKRLLDLGLTNYWGYNTLGFFAPDRRFAAGDDPATELKTAVKALHAAGLEVLLDVAFNHTAEGGQDGVVLSFKGLGNLSYYRLNGKEPGGYENLSGCGNTLDIRHPRVLGLVLDSLRYWVREFHVDGFRFDLAPVLGRHRLSTESPFDPEAPIFDALRRDPVLQGVKLIAEPWDLGSGGYSLGRFPQRWAQWNDRYRDAVRSFWRGDPGRVPSLATRLTGSADLFTTPCQSVNYVACHDGFTLRDLVSYEERLNHSNGEDGRDGHAHNLSRGWGAQGPEASPEVEALRSRAQRNFLATLALSRGIPMLGHGDELNRSQQGNNNAYCHDSPLTWMSWRIGAPEELLRAFAKRVFQIRRQHPLLRRCSFFEPATGRGDRARWFLADGRELDQASWAAAQLHAFAVLLEPADPASEAPLLLLLNSGEEERGFDLPPAPASRSWQAVLDTASFPSLPATGRPADVLVPYSLRLFCGC